MKFRYNAPAILITAVLIVITTISVVSTLIAHRMTASAEERQFELMAKAMNSRLKEAENRATAGAEMIAALPKVKQLFAERKREELLAATGAVYAIQREKYGMSQAQFHLPDITSFLRVHNPSKFGESLSHYREMVVDVNRNKAIRKGIEITTSGIAIFGTVPMTDEKGAHTGSFEMGLEIGPLLDELKKDYGFEIALLIDEKILRETATSLKGDVFNEQNRVGKFVKFYTTHPELSRALLSANDVNIAEDTHFMRESSGVAYGVQLLPVYNYAKKPIGVIAITDDFSATRAADGAALVWQVLLALISIVLLTGVIHAVIRGLLLKPLKVLGDHMDALASGDSSQRIEYADSFCEEMQHLADNYELLRVRAEKSDQVEGEHP